MNRHFYFVFVFLLFVFSFNFNYAFASNDLNIDIPDSNKIQDGSSIYVRFNDIGANRYAMSLGTTCKQGLYTEGVGNLCKNSYEVLPTGKDVLRVDGIVFRNTSNAPIEASLHVTAYFNSGQESIKEEHVNIITNNISIKRDDNIKKMPADPKKENTTKKPNVNLDIIVNEDKAVYSVIKDIGDTQSEQIKDKKIDTESSQKNISEMTEAQVEINRSNPGIWVSISMFFKKLAFWK